MSAQVQIIEKNGQPEYAIVPIDDYHRLLALAEDAEDIRAANQARKEFEAGEDEFIPSEIADRLFEGEEHPLRVWREYRGITQGALAERAKVGKSYISQIESGSKPGSVAVLARLASVLALDIDDLVVAG
jgi:DNA-binding XRE family transcriptional regulator